MAGKTNITATYFSQKKLLGKANTSILKKDYEEAISSNIQTNANIIFGETVTSDPFSSISTIYGNDGIVEYLEFDLEQISGTKYLASESVGGEGSQISGFHSYRFKFKSDYETNSTSSSNFTNSSYVHEYLGRAQLVSTFYSELVPNPYNIKIFDSNGTEIPLADEIDWSVDYYNGILFLQDFDANKIPATAKCFVYIGNYLNDQIANASASGDNEYIQSISSNFLSATGSMSFSGGEGYNFNTSNVGSDTFFFVSGSLDGQNNSVFGGDVVVSGSFNLANSTSIIDDAKGIKHQFALNDYTGSLLTINDLGSFEKRSYVSPVYAKSTGSNSDLIYMVQYSGIPSNIESVLTDGFYGPKTLPVMGTTQNSKIIFVHDTETSSVLSTQHNFIFDATHQGNPAPYEELQSNNSYDNQSYAYRGSYLSDINSDLNFSYDFFNNGNNTISFDTTIETDMSEDSTTAAGSLSYNNASTVSAWPGLRSTSNEEINLLDYTYTRNNITETLSNFSINVFLPSQPIDITRQNFIDINSEAFENYVTGSDASKHELRHYSDSSGNIANSSIKAIDRQILDPLGRKWEQLYSYYLSNNLIERIKAGTKVSVNRRTELTDRYLTTNKDAILNTCISPAADLSFRRNSPKLTNTTLFGCLYTMLATLSKAIENWNNNPVNTSSQISSLGDPANYNQFKWDQISQLVHSSWNPSLLNSGNFPFTTFSPFPYARLRYYYVPTVIDTYQKLIALYDDIVENYPGFESTSVDLRYTLDPQVTFNNFTFSYRDPSSISVYNNAGYTVQVNGAISTQFDSNTRNTTGYFANLKFNEVYNYFKDYDEYLYYRALYNTNISDPTGRDYAIETNRTLLNANTNDISDIQTQTAERDLTLRKSLILAQDPALFVNGASAFLGPVSITQLESQSPIKVFTSFQFGEEQQVLGDDGAPLTGSDGSIVTSSKSLLTLNSKGFEGDLQVTGSIDITGFDSSDGMRINMGNLVMTNDQNGFNMPQFNMINTNSEPYERPTILLSNNLSSFASGTKAYQMGEIAFAGPTNDSPEDDQENILIRAQINELTGSSAVNYLSFDFYINEARNKFKNLDGTIPVANQKTSVLVVGQYNDDQVVNENGISEGLGVRGNIVPLGVVDNTDANVGHILSTDYTLGTTRWRWGGLHLGEESPVTFGNLVRSHSKLSFDATYRMPVFSGSVGFQHGLSGSLTSLLDGTQYIKGINGVIVSTGSNGSVSIGLEGYLSSSVSQTSDNYSETGLSGSQVSFNQSTFELANYNDNNIKFYLNGQLLSSGSLQEVSVDANKDYFVSPDTGTVTFASEVFPEDVLTAVYYNDTSDSRGQYRYDRILSTDQAAGTKVWFNFDFAIIDNDYDKFEVYVNGQQLSRIESLANSGTQPYTIFGQNRLIFDSDLYATDIITLLFKIPNPFSTGGGEDDEENEGSELNSKIKETRKMTQQYNALSAVSFTDLPFDLDIYSKDVLMVYLNGQLLLPGTLTNIQSGRADYFIENSTVLKFADVITPGDVITFDLLVPGYENAFADTIFVTSNKSLLNNTLQVTGSNGISVETNTENIFIKNDKEMIFNEVLQGGTDGINQNFHLNHVPWSSNEISIFVDGNLKVPSGSAATFDYQVAGNQINFSSLSTPTSGSLIMAIYNRVI